MRLDKPKIVDAIRSRVREQLDGLKQMTAMARDEATGGESKAENKYDTRALEASYLAAGQGQRLAELRTTASWYGSFDATKVVRTANIGALVGLDGESGTRWVFIAPSGGIRVSIGDHTVDVVSPQSPVGRALLGQRQEDEIILNSPRGAEHLEIISVQ